jgi:pimeloyl-ACP methyl ester carboxylesterase
MPPLWFVQAIEAPFESYMVEVDGARIEARSWGRVGAPGLLLLHGNAAHLGWWSYLAPFFAEDFRVTAFSFSGMGGSDWREVYSAAIFAREMWAVADATGVSAAETPPVVVAHSMGGVAAIHAAAAVDRPLRAAVLIDVALPGPVTFKVSPYRGHRSYPSFGAALGRFRLTPSQPCGNAWIAEYLGRMAIRETAAGDEPSWTWRFDPRLTDGIDYGDIWGDLARMKAPVAVIRGEQSALTAGPMIEQMMATLPVESPLIIVPDAHHHVMIDQPLALVATLRTLLAAWVG